MAHGAGLWLYEMFALRDLKTRVLDKTGRGDEPSLGFGRPETVFGAREILSLWVHYTKKLLGPRIITFLRHESRAGDEGNQRLKAVLREMKGPPAELTKLLGGLDADVILCS